MRVVLGVSGGIAAYKAAALLRLFSESGHDVTVVPTAAALEFVGAPTWAALSGKPVASDVWTAVDRVPHVRIGQEADLVVVAPATADLLAKAACGLADDLLTATLLTARCPVVFAPAMHTEMWLHPATQANVATLRSRGAHVIDPASGRLTGADTVRFLGNRSSGKQGVALAEVAAARGAEVTLIACNLETAVLPRSAMRVLSAGSALELADAVAREAESADVVVMCAAVADFRPKHYAEAKIKKTHGSGHDDSAPVVELVRNPDILAGLVARRGAQPSPVIVGFAAETGDDSGSVLELSRAKLARKGCDLLVANEVGSDKTFGADTNFVHLLFRDGRSDIAVGPTTKRRVSEALWDAVATLLPHCRPIPGNPSRVARPGAIRAHRVGR